MSEPVIVLPDGAGRTFIESGLIAIRSSRDRLFEKRESRSSGSWMNSVAVHHEWIHFLQSITCAAVHTASQLILTKSREVVQAAAKGDIPETLSRELRDAESAVYATGTDERMRIHDMGSAVVFDWVEDNERVDMLDLMEGVAVLESFRMCTANAEPEHFLAFLDEHFPGDGNAVYRRAFEFLAEAIGLEAAFELLPPISFIALQDKQVPQAFVRHVGVLAGVDYKSQPLRGNGLKRGPRDKALDPRDLTEYPALLEALELDDDTWGLPHAFTDGEPETGHVCLDPCGVLAVQRLGLDRVLQLAAVPHRLTPEEFQVLRAPLTVYSGDDRTIIEPNGALDVQVHRNVIYATSLTGAALRLIDRDKRPYQFCPQAGRCPHFENALCYRQFAPPRESRSYEECGFPMLTKAEVGMDPSELWAAVDRGLKSREQLAKAFEDMGEAGILELCRKERASLTKWLGADGYADIDWKCEAVSEKVVRALRTQKMDHFAEARWFRDAVVNEVRKRLLEASP
jgi:hypothetical protein